MTDIQLIYNYALIKKKWRVNQHNGWIHQKIKTGVEWHPFKGIYFYVLSKKELLNY